MLSLQNIELNRGSKSLLQEVNLNLYDRQKIGLIGHNGCGKSSLFALILNQLQHDKGEIVKSPSLEISHLEQEIPNTDTTILNFVLSGDKAYSQLITSIAQAEKQGLHDKIAPLYQSLEEMDGYRKPAMAATILAGLGFTTEQLEAPVKSLSGGWRMRLNLAKTLFQPAQLMLLDEPTNHLDLETIHWLENWLKETPTTLLLISHDRDFLDGIVSHIAHVEGKKLHLYTGNYSQFEQARAIKLQQTEALFQKQEAKIKHLMSYVNRFKAKASHAKQAQSRLKALDKMELVAKANVDSPFSFEFKAIGKVSNPLMSLSKVSMGYHPDKPILKNVEFNLYPGDRIGLLGKNGQGKSTFIKTLTQGLKPLDGQIHYGAHTKIGYFAQHQVDSLDLTISPVQTILTIEPTAREQDVRQFLGGFDFQGDMATTPIHHFSGGEKARLALASLVWQSPNVLLLDEPTNHLDLNMRSALLLALETYQGALILISHDRHLISHTVEAFYLIDNGRLQPFQGQLHDYYKLLKEPTPSQTATKAKADPSRYKDQKVLQNRLKKIETEEAVLKEALAKLEAALTDLSLYEPNQAARLQETLSQQKALQERMHLLEEEWLTIMEKLQED